MPTQDAGRRTLGPVADLERHLPNDWWRTLFNALYLKTDGDVVENALNTAADIDLVLAATNLDREAQILDLCCGQGRHVLELARRGFRKVSGLDRSRALIRLARSRARSEGLDVRFREGDARKFRLPPNSFDCVTILGNSFGYFDRSDDDLAVLKAVARVLRDGGIVFLDLADGEWMRTHFEPRSWEWIDQEHFVCRERALSQDGERLISREVVVHAERGVIADQFYGERLYNEKQIQTLLERAGFEAVQVQEAAKTQSLRNQDLGMMAHRMIVVARLKPKSAASKKRPATFPNVTVLLGDPRLPDRVKLGGHFNPEDLDTVSRMKKALAEIPGYSFEYLDRHDTLIETLAQKPPLFVLNLCDEGFRNDALKELHIPALLELHTVPYSGAGPTTLGLCYDKALVSAIAQALGIPVPSETYYDAEDAVATLPSVFPALVKPVCGDSSIGITKDAVVRNAEELTERVATLRKSLPGVSMLVQEFLRGTEYTVGIIGNPGISHDVLPILEVDYSALDSHLPPILSYESKWELDSPYCTQIRYVETKAPRELRNRLVDYSIALFQRLGCRDYARFDFRANENGEVKLLEVNPNPGWCWDGKMNMMAGLAGWSYSEMLRRILQAAQERIFEDRERNGLGSALVCAGSTQI